MMILGGVLMIVLKQGLFVQGPMQHQGLGTAVEKHEEKKPEERDSKAHGLVWTTCWKSLKVRSVEIWSEFKKPHRIPIDSRLYDKEVCPLHSPLVWRTESPS